MMSRRGASPSKDGSSLGHWPGLLQIGAGDIDAYSLIVDGPAGG